MTVIKCHYRTPKYVDMGIKLTVFSSSIQKKELQRNTMQPKNENQNFIFSAIFLCILLSKMQELRGRLKRRRKTLKICVCHFFTTQNGIYQFQQDLRNQVKIRTPYCSTHKPYCQKWWRRRVKQVSKNFQSLLCLIFNRKLVELNT